MATGLLGNRPWVGLVEECVELYDELDRLTAQEDAPSREMAVHVTSRLLEILERAGVTTIAGGETFERRLHEPAMPTSAVRPGAAIAEFLSPGFAVERRVFRRARVRLDTRTGGATNG
jgi:molecular chaperone GrpE (heat shock protein)